MDRNQVKQMMPIIQAYAEGKIIECRTKPSTIKGTDVPNDWTEIKDISFWDNIEYRIKPEVKFRPFANAKECWEEMMKHQPFGWVKVGDWYCIMKQIRPTSAFCHGGGDVFHYEDMVKQITFADGTPFGIKVED